MIREARLAQAAGLIHAYLSRAAESGRRYLWTDAFAVSTLVALAETTRDPRHDLAALDLLKSVHGTLGRHRRDDGREGWLSGKVGSDAEEHPTAGGLRIGKPLPERKPHEPYEPELEWERDGQYFHYLTRWMFALDRVARRRGDERVHRWARELAVVAHHAFTYGPPGGRRMYWKMSADLTRPLVPSMGQHDPLDGYVTCVALDASARDMGFAPRPTLDEMRRDFGGMVRPGELATSDPLGLGALLEAGRRLEGTEDPLREPVHEAAAAGLVAFLDSPERRRAAEHRLAFRELGLAIGLATVREDDTELHPYVALRDEIEAFWLDPAHRRAHAWRAHEDINSVMLAASLCAQHL